MRINQKQLKRHRHRYQIRLPAIIKRLFKNEIIQGDIPSNQQIKIAVNLGLVNKDDHGHLDPKSLANYFKTFIQQRRADNERQNDLR